MIFDNFWELLLYKPSANNFTCTRNGHCYALTKPVIIVLVSYECTRILIRFDDVFVLGSSIGARSEFDGKNESHHRAAEKSNTNSWTGKLTKVSRNRSGELDTAGCTLNAESLSVHAVAQCISADDFDAPLTVFSLRLLSNHFWCPNETQSQSGV